jgi:DNA repair exonuclease SbcCD ATPase subunit
MNRVRVIKLTSESPLGRQELGASNVLDKYDLIVIYGPNGAGKSTIVDALKNVKSIDSVDQDGESVTLDKKNVSQDLLYRSGRGLMESFTSMKDALARASGIRRLKEEGRLVQLLAGETKLGFDAQMPKEDTTTSEEISSAIEANRQAEERLSLEPSITVPLTLREYNNLGREVADLLKKEWSDINEVDDNEMLKSENAVKPSNSVEFGDQVLKNAISQAIGTLKNPVEQLKEDYKRVNDALSAAIEQAKTLAPLAKDEQRPIEKDWADRCRRVANEVDEETSKKKALFDSLSELETLRSDTLKWLADNENDQSCPVCDQAIDLDTLKNQLGDYQGDDESKKIDKEIRQLYEKISCLKKQASTIDTCNDDVEACNSRFEKYIERLTRTGTDFRQASTPTNEWHESLKSVAKELRIAATEFDQAISSIDSSLTGHERLDKALSAATVLHNKLHNVQKHREQLDQQANEDIVPATQKYNQLEPLRRLLVVRDRLNKLDWSPNWDKKRIVEAKRKVINRWKQAAQELHVKYAKNEADVQDTVLQDEGVKNRFSRLLEKTNHPFLEAASFTSHSIEQNGQTVHDKLSEGYQVIVNLAAFIAVTGYKNDGAEHQAGWLVLDEPSNGLDHINRSHVAKYLGGLSKEEMPRQIFVSTFEKEFQIQLINAGIGSGRQVLEIELSRWSTTPAAPQLKPHIMKL